MLHNEDFDYVGQFADDSFRKDEILVQAHRRPESEGGMLVGDQPAFRFWEDRLVVMARSVAPVKWVSFPVGDAVFFTARPGDRVRALTFSGYLALRILRGEELVLGLGALSWIDLGRDVRVTRPEPSSRMVAVAVGDLRRSLEPRGSVTLGEYQVYVERGGTYAMGAVAECLSVVRAGDTAASNAALRSAVLLGKSWFHEWLDGVRGERASGKVIRAPEEKTRAKWSETQPPPGPAEEHWWSRYLPRR